MPHRQQHEYNGTNSNTSSINNNMTSTMHHSGLAGDSLFVTHTEAAPHGAAARSDVKH
jgi:hypothetical protein